LACFFGAILWSCKGQTTTGLVFGAVVDPGRAAVPRAAIAATSLETGVVARTETDAVGRFWFLELPPGAYRITVEKEGFAKLSRGPVVLRLNQKAELDFELVLATARQELQVTAGTPLINTTDAEIGATFDALRISELPIAPGRSILNLILSAPGVSELSPGQAALARSGVDPGGGSSNLSFSVNGMGVRSNNFVVDGQDSNEAIVSGMVQALNNPDLIAECRLLTGQFAPEYGRNTGSVVIIATRGGANHVHGSAFWFHNDRVLNARGNLDERLLLSAPYRADNQMGGTLGGPLRRDRTFFFGSLQRWTDYRLGSGVTVRGIPTPEGFSLLDSIAGDRPTVRLLRQHLPAAQQPVPGLATPVTAGGRTVSIPLGLLTGSGRPRFHDWQWSARLDHHFSPKHVLGARMLFDDAHSTGGGQVTPPLLGQVRAERKQSVAAFLTTTAGARTNDLRVSFWRLALDVAPDSPAALSIPSIEILELGLSGGASLDPTRTALGFSSVYPTSIFENNYQIQDTGSILSGNHWMKFGFDSRRQDVTWFFFPTLRGQLTYSTLQNFVDDVAQAASQTVPLAGAETTLHFRQYDNFFFFQDQWRVGKRLTLTYGLRYESPGTSFGRLLEQNRRTVALLGGDPRYAVTSVPGRDGNNWAPRFGFNYRISARGPVLRGGYGRSYDAAYPGIAGAIATSFPFQKTVTLTQGAPDALAALQRAAAAPITNPSLLPRTQFASDFRAPYAEQFSVQLEREWRQNWAASAGWVGAKGTALFQTVDANPTAPGSNGSRRADPARGVVRERCNCSSSIYHSLQISLQKRLSGGLAFATHYTWSSFLNLVSDLQNPSVNGEVALAQDSYNRAADRGRSAYDRPHRLAFNGLWSLPAYTRAQNPVVARLFSGWQLSSFGSLQSGAPFTVLDGADPGFRLTGMSALAGNSIRGHARAGVDLSGMSVESIVQAGGAGLFSRVTAASPLGSLGRNTLRADGISILNLGLTWNAPTAEASAVQIRAEFYNAANTRNFGIPEARLAAANFLNQWGQEGGNRRILLALRYRF